MSKSYEVEIKSLLGSKENADMLKKALEKSYPDMKLIGERHPIDLAFLPIGDNFTMGPEDAAYAAKLLGAKTIVPIHFNTFPPIKQDPNQFIKMLDNKNGKVLLPGESIEL